MNVLLQQATDALESGTLVDMTETPTSTAGRLVPEGSAFVRFTGYVELGKHATTYQGETKAPTMQYVLQGHIVGGAGDGADGEPEEYVQEGKYISMNTMPANLALGDKAGSTKIFNALKGKKPYTSFVQCLGGLYIIPVLHRTAKASGKPYAVLDWAKATAAIDPVTRKAYDYPDVSPEQYKLLLQRQPTIEQWDSIYIEGEWQAKDGKPAESKNKYQLMCQEATDFAGSSLEQLLMGNGLDVLDLTDNSVDTTEVEPPAIPDVPED